MDKFEFNIVDVEKEFNIRITSNILCIGLDTASKTGYCIANVDDKTIKFEVGYFNVDVKGIKDKKLRRRIYAENIFNNLKKLFIGKIFDIAVIEDVFFGRNVHTTILLSRIGGIAYALSQEYGTQKVLWKTASEARKAIGLKGNAKKKEITDAINSKLGLEIKNDNITDAIVLALNGLKEN